MIPTGYVLGFDASYYQHHIDLAEVRKHVKFAIFRATYGTFADPAFRRHVIEFAPDLAVAAYAWFRPNQDVNAQLEVIRSQLASLPIKFVWADLEESSFMLSSEKLSEKAFQFVRGLQTMVSGVGVYTRTTFVIPYMQEALPWLPRYPLWLASYPYANLPKLIMPWETMLRDWAPTRYLPYYCNGWPTTLKANMWQFAGGKFILPGIRQESGSAIGIDLNLVPETYLSVFEDGAVAEITEPPSGDALAPVLARLDNIEQRLDALEKE